MHRRPRIALGEHPSRRQALVAAGGLWVFGCGESGGSDPVHQELDAGAMGDPRQVCILYPQQVEGPYYKQEPLVRRNVTEGRPGLPLTLSLRLVAPGTCQPLTNVAVDIWHCDAAGLYSGFPGQLGGVDTSGETFLRGTQMSDERGLATFETIYPGWYPGRTTHIHFKVRPTGRTAATSQIYFPDHVNALVYERLPYAARGPKDVSNRDDGANQAGGVPAFPDFEVEAEGFRASLTIGVAP